MRRLRQMFRMRKHLPKLREVRAAGGPKRIELVDVGEPEGLLVPTAEITVDVHAKRGGKTRFEQAMPLPPLWTLAYRIGRKLRLPLIRDLAPERLHFELPVPRRDK